MEVGKSNLMVEALLKELVPLVGELGPLYCSHKESIFYDVS